MPTILNRILENLNNATPSYEYPGPELDRLFEVTYKHPEDEETCDDCDEAREITRSDRPTNSSRVHCGVIASGSQVIMDPAMRDRLGSDCICFEMEAAGLMNDFPCLVIRGICDYADSHKNDCWQRYAAAAAAACAKEILHIMPEVEVENERLVRDVSQAVIEAMKEPVGEVVRHTGKISRDVEVLRDQAILNWLTPIDYSPQQRDFISRRQPGTGLWFLDSAEFQAWLSKDKQTLFCPGIPGAGKTMITAIVIDYLQSRFLDDQSTGIAYIYCNFRRQDEQNAEDLLASLLKQLARSRPASVKDLYDRHQNEGRNQILTRSQELSIPWLPHIRESSSLSMHLTNARQPYLNKQMSLRMSGILDDDNQDMTRTGMVKAADGMFLLVTLHTETLLTQPTKGHLKQALQALGKGMEGLGTTYDQAMERVEGQEPNSRDLAKRILAWIVHSKRSLSTLELQHALAVQPDTTALNTDFVPKIERLRSLCAGLVTIDEESSVIRLVHYTTQEYFERKQKQQKSWFPEAEFDITTACITYLSFDMFKSGFCLTDAELEQRLRSNPLYNYAARSWGHHAHEASTSKQVAAKSRKARKARKARETRAKIEARVISFLESKAKVEASSQAMLATKRYSKHSNYSQEAPRNMAGLHLAAYFGLDEAGSTLLTGGHSPDLRDSYCRTPLSYAAERGHELAAKLLLETGLIDVNSESYNTRTPLSYAAEKGHEKVVKLLLTQEGLKLNPRSKYGQTPLSWAAVNGHEKVVKLLVETKGVEVNSQSNSRWTPLSYAAANGHNGVVRLLVTVGGVDVDSMSLSGRTSISLAAENGHQAIIELLLANKRVDVNLKDNDGQTPLSWAVKNGKEEAVKLLLANERVDVNLKDNDGRPPLCWAAASGEEKAVELLLAHERVDVNPKDKDGRTPLSWAAANGKKEAAKMLLANKRVDVNSKDNDGLTPLFWAVKNGKEWAVKLLLVDERVDVNLRDDDSRLWHGLLGRADGEFGEWKRRIDQADSSRVDYCQGVELN
ncbi:hypothetical protein FNYG_15198 [Fusarium nygamai]|uniref:Uncharacterized protein n=1 Tax=Gibberella nygamai TaxID=42673 RepID=A0A2K0UIW7_GIBNY|nr:hypothetical protein FNYG_15198 [Fusarium nygamai]